MTEKNVWQKIAEARTKISVKKNGNNKHGGYNYYQLNDIYTEAKKVFNELGLVTVFNMHKEKEPVTLSLKYNTYKDVPNNNKPEKIVNFKDVETPLYVCTLDVINVEKPDEKATFSIEIPYSQQDGASFAQSLGGTCTYATKYLFLALLMLDDTEDDDAKNDHKEPPIATEKQEPKETPKQQSKKLEGKPAINYKKELLDHFENDFKKMMDYVKTFCNVSTPKEEHFKSTYEDLFHETEDDITLEQSAPPEEPKEVQKKRV